MAAIEPADLPRLEYIHKILLQVESVLIIPKPARSTHQQQKLIEGCNYLRDVGLSFAPTEYQDTIMIVQIYEEIIEERIDLAMRRSVVSPCLEESC